MKQNQFEFKPFERVLVRENNNSAWKCQIYSHKVIKDNETYHMCMGHMYEQCIPYEGNEQYYRTSNAYIAPQPKEYHVWSNSFDEWMTEDEFQNFINTAVIHNKDITDFHVLRVKP